MSDRMDPLGIYINVYIYIHVYEHIYIYIERERERYIHFSPSLCIYIYIYMCKYIGLSISWCKQIVLGKQGKDICKLQHFQMFTHKL